ncbi:hypothetical protein QAD02_000414 [Eretmocerus hayati]|uniref:Uncharacterized protein n=1 Tax=Eretmocerus hayati TaxID=131215 RepID=A0ACC2NDC8_9HYME|nr:hypothetical protein QAD02_000414 [Eretmocerus hayati]
MRQGMQIRRLKQRAKKRSAQMVEKLGFTRIEHQEKLSEALADAAVAQREVELLRIKLAEAEAAAVKARDEQVKTMVIHTETAYQTLLKNLVEEEEELNSGESEVPQLPDIETTVCEALTPISMDMSAPKIQLVGAPGFAFQHPERVIINTTDTDAKKYLCIFCYAKGELNLLSWEIIDHLISCHKDEARVKTILSLPPAKRVKG